MNEWNNDFYYYWRTWSGLGEGGKIGVSIDIAYAIRGKSFEEVMDSNQQYYEELVRLGFFGNWTSSSLITLTSRPSGQYIAIVRGSISKAYTLSAVMYFLSCVSNASFLA